MVGRGRLARWKWLVAIACVVLLAGACSDAESPTSATPAIIVSVPTSSAPTPAPTSTTMPTSQSPEVAESAGWPTEGWPVSTPEEQGIDSGVLVDLVDRVVAVHGIDSLTVIRNGYLVLDTVVYPFPADTGHIIHSCTKSITATLIGIAIAQGLLDGVDVPVVELLADAAPVTVDDLKASMTVEDLLTMSTGLECRDSYLYDWQGMVEMQASDEWAAHVLALPMSEEPGTRFEYCNGSSLLLSAILSEVTGKPAAEYATEVLFEPLGISDVWWPATPDGITIGWGELVLRPPDMAKIGYLYLRNGEWDGAQLVPQQWIEAATSAHIAAETLSDGYGYQWWIDDAGYAMAQGFGGQYIIVVPDQDLVVVFTSGLFGERQGQPEQFTTEYVLSAVSSNAPLPPNSDAQARLAAAVAAARTGPEPANIEMPEMAAAVDGIRYEFRTNELGAGWFMIRFGGDSAVLMTEDVDGPTELEVGLAGRFVTDEAVPVTARGTWRGVDTFVIEYQVIGQVERGTLEFTFEGDVAHVKSVERATGVVETSVADRVG